MSVGCMPYAGWVRYALSVCYGLRKQEERQNRTATRQPLAEPPLPYIAGLLSLLIVKLPKCDPAHIAKVNAGGLCSESLERTED